MIWECKYMEIHFIRERMNERWSDVAIRICAYLETFFMLVPRKKCDEWRVGQKKISGERWNWWWWQTTGRMKMNGCKSSSRKRKVRLKSNQRLKFRIISDISNDIKEFLRNFIGIARRDSTNIDATVAHDVNMMLLNENLTLTRIKTGVGKHPWAMNKTKATSSSSFAHRDLPVCWTMCSQLPGVPNCFSLL